MSKSILIVEDEPDIIELVKYKLEKEHFTVYSAKNGEDGIDSAKKNKPDLVILDIMLPGIDGLELAKKLKTHDITCHIPIIMLTAKNDEIDVIVGLEVGADDYISKPFSPKILVSRVKAVLRRYKSSDQVGKLKTGNITIDERKHRVTVSGKDISLTATEFKLLKYIANRPGIVLTRDNLLDGVFGYESAIYDRTIDTHIKSIRKKLGKASKYIETVRGVGYRFKENGR